MLAKRAVARASLPGRWAYRDRRGAMRSPVSAAVPTCAPTLKARAELAGRPIKCRGCAPALRAQAAPGVARALPAGLAKPAEARPVAPPPPPPAAPIGFADD